jgi:thiol:disulfide interchange protein DsbD
VDFTADWCLSRKVNERVASGRPKLLVAFKKHGVVKLKTGGTSDDPVVTAESNKFGRSSGPFICSLRRAMRNQCYFRRY